MNLQQLLLIFKARYKVILVTFLVIVLATLAISLIVPARYTASTSVVVDIRSSDPIGIGTTLDGPVTPSYLPTQVDIINSDRTALRVVKELRLAENPAVREKWQEATGGRGQIEPWIADLMQKGLDVHPSTDSNVIMLTYTSADPEFSAAAANAFAKAYIDTNIGLKVDPAKQYAQWFIEQGKMLRENMERAQRRLAEYQQKNGIVITDERLDNEMAKLNDLSSQLTIVEALTADAQSKQSATSASSLNDVRENSLILNLKAEINRKEAELREAAGNLGQNHPQYKSMQAQIASLRQQLEEETRNITQSFSTSETVSNSKADNLRKLIATQKQRILDLKNERDEAAILLNDVATAEKAYETVSQRYNQTNLQSQAEQTNVSILTPAIPPLQPSAPLPMLYTLIAAVIGLILGVIFAFTAEMLDRRVRVSDDIEQNLGLPVLAELTQQQGKVTRWWKRLRLFRKPKTLEFAT